MAAGCIPKPSLWAFHFFANLEGECVHRDSRSLILHREDGSYDMILWHPDEEVQETVLDLGTEDMYRIFGGPIHPETEKEFRECAYQYLEDRYQVALEAVQDGQWLRVDRIGMRMLGKESLSSAEYLYLYPPGVPLLAPGEEITPGLIALADDLTEEGYELQGTEDYTHSSIWIVKEDT